MTDQNTQQNDYRATGGGEQRGAAENLNWGSARTDYGDNAYGGRLDKRGLERGADIEPDDEYRVRAWRKWKSRRGANKGDWANRGLMLLGGTVVGVGVGVGIGLGVGLAAMYLLDPKEGKNRRDTARGKFNDARHKAGDFINQKTGDLRNRASRAMASGTRRNADGEQTAGETNAADRALTNQAA